MFRTQCRVATALTVCVAMLTSGSVSAATVNAEVVLDLNTKISQGAFDDQISPPLQNAPVTVNNGDTVVLHIGFEPGQLLHWEGDGEFNPRLFTFGPGGHFAGNGLSVDLLDLTEGTPISAAALAGASFGTCCASLGPVGIAGENVPRTFSGVVVSYVVTFTDGAMTRTYNLLDRSPQLFTGHVSVMGVVTTPIPTTLALFASALGGLGAIQWRRKRQGSYSST